MYNKSIIIDIDYDGKIIDWSNRDKIKRCILDLVSLCDSNNNNLKKDLGAFCFQKEFKVVRVSTARQSGCTQAQLQILREYENACMVCLTLKQKSYFKKHDIIDIKDRIFYTSEFINNMRGLKNYEIVLVDIASHNENVDRIIENCSYMDNCVCVLIG